MSECASPMSILQRYIVVDDDRMNNMVSKFIIQRHNKEAEIQLYTDPELALSEICQLSSDADDKRQTIVLLDINMPMMNGWEFLDEFKRLNIDPLGKCKIYIISSSVFSNDINKARSYPLVKDFISKPLNVEKIVELFRVEDPA